MGIWRARLILLTRVTVVGTRCDGHTIRPDSCRDSVLAASYDWHGWHIVPCMHVIHTCRLVHEWLIVPCMHANSATHTCRLVLNYTETVISNVHEADAYPYTVAKMDEEGLSAQRQQ